MPIPRFEVPSGVIDGVNTVFTVSVAYQMGTTAVFLNGQLMRADFADGWVETDPAGGQVTMNIAPQDLDVVQVFFIDTSPKGIEDEVTPIQGILVTDEDLLGRLAEDDLPLAMLEDEEVLDGLLADDAVVGVLVNEFELRGQLFFEES